MHAGNFGKCLSPKSNRESMPKYIISCLNTNYSINEQEGPGMLISLELLPLICVENWFPCSILGIFSRFSSNFLLKLILGRSGSDCRWANFVK